MQTFVSTSRVFNYFSKTVHSEWIIKDNPARALKHNTPVHVSSKHNGLRLAGCVKRWRTDGNIKTGLPAVSKSQWEEGSLEADCHIYTGSWQRKKKKKCKLQARKCSRLWVMPVSAHVADPWALTLPVNSDMCVRRWRTAGRKISCCLNKRDQRDAGGCVGEGGRKTRVADTRVADTRPATLRWWCCLMNRELKLSR